MEVDTQDPDPTEPEPQQQNPLLQPQQAPHIESYRWQCITNWMSYRYTRRRQITEINSSETRAITGQ